MSNPISISLLGELQVQQFIAFDLYLLTWDLKWAVWILGILDRFSGCNSTLEYSGRKISWVDSSRPSGHRRASSESCDVFSGKWVFDNTSYPLYKESDCPYMSDQLACHKHGRSDLGYQYWRWQPHNCNLKRCFCFLSYPFCYHCNHCQSILRFYYLFSWDFTLRRGTSKELNDTILLLSLAN